jgi:hypothetical protein
VLQLLPPHVLPAVCDWIGPPLHVRACEQVKRKFLASLLAVSAHLGSLHGYATEAYHKVPRLLALQRLSSPSCLISTRQYVISAAQRTKTSSKVDASPRCGLLAGCITHTYIPLRMFQERT